jgi:hypothetical protein
MLDDILSALHEVQGVQATLVIDGGGKLLAYRAHAVYDLDLLQVVGRGLVTAVDSVQVVHSDWEFVTANFSEGKVLIRNLRSGGRDSQTFYLAVIADNQLNRSFAGVAIRVAAAKLRAELDAGAGSASPVPRQTGTLPTMSAPVNASGSRQATPASGARADLTGSGLSWSVSVTGAASSAGASGVAVLDSAASAFLSSSTKALSGSVGPMAKVFVKEAVRKICPDRPFSRDDGAALIAELEKRIDDPDDLKLFRKSMKSA